MKRFLRSRTFTLLVRRAHALAIEDHGATRPPQRLVRRGGHNIGVVERRLDDARGDEARDVRHVEQEETLVGVRNL